MKIRQIKWMGLSGLLLLGGIAGAEEAKEVKLVNAGFESTEKPVTAAWLAGSTGWTKGTKEGYCDITNDAKEGKQAVHLKQGFLRYKIIAKDLHKKSLSVKFFAKGSGKLRCNIAAFYKEDGKWRRMDLKSNIGAGLPLSDQYLAYTVKFAPLPEKIIFFNLVFGDYTKKDWFIDDMKMFCQDEPFDLKKKVVTKKNAPLPKSYFTGRGELPEGLVNIAPYAKIRTNPFGMMTYRVTDGIMGTGFSFEKFPETGARTIEFIYDSPQTISSVRLSIPPADFAIYADTTGGGKYTKLLKNVRGGPKLHYWNRKEWPWFKADLAKPLKVYALKYIDFSKKSAPFMEFQIVSPKAVSGSLMKKISMSANVAVLTAGKNLPVPAAKPDQQYLQGFTIEPWMFSCPGLVKERRMGVNEPLANWAPLRKMLDDYKFFKANFMLLFPPKTCEGVADRKGTFAWDVMWPSKVWRWQTKYNLLKEFCSAVRKQNISVFTVIRYRYFRQDIPYPPANELKTYGLYGNNVNQSISEMAGSDVDAVSLCLDEQYYNASHPIFYFQKKTVPANAANKLKKKLNYENELAGVRIKAFKKRFDLKTDKLPATPTDTELYRKYVLFYFEQIAERMQDSNRLAKKANPKVKTLAAFATTDHFNNRFTRASDHDIFGFNADIDYMVCDPYFTREDCWGWYHPSYMAQVLRASSPKRQVGLTLNYNWGGGKPKRNPLCAETYPAICYIGAVLGGALNGAGAFDFWRYNFACSLDPIAGGRENVKKAFAMLDTLAAWGGKKAHTPKDTAVLRSRASEDWWQLKVLYGKWDGNKAENSKGFSYYKWIASQLMRNAYAFETYFMDHPEAYKNITQFKTVILPFPYSMSKEALNIIENAVNSGTEVIVLGAKGETDELGRAYSEPLLSGLIKAGKITYFDADILKDAHFPELENRFKKLLNRKLGERRTLFLERYGKDIQVGCLEKNPYEKLVVLINWSDSDTFADIGVRMPEDRNYRILRRDLEKVNEMALNGKNILSASDLKKIRVSMKSGEAKILYILSN